MHGTGGADGAETTLRVNGGTLAIVKELQGKQLHDSMDMRFVEIHGRLTGDSLATLSFSLNSPFSGTAEQMSRIPIVRVERFEAEA